MFNPKIESLNNLYIFFNQASPWMLIFLSTKKPTAIKHAVSGRLFKPVLHLKKFEATEVKHEIIEYFIHCFYIYNNFSRLSAG